MQVSDTTLSYANFVRKESASEIGERVPVQKCRHDRMYMEETPRFLGEENALFVPVQVTENQDPFAASFPFLMIMNNKPNRIVSRPKHSLMINVGEAQLTN